MKNTIFDMSKIDGVECVTITYQQGELETKIGYAPNLGYWSGTKHSTSRCGVETLEELRDPLTSFKRNLYAAEACFSNSIS